MPASDRGINQFTAAAPKVLEQRNVTAAGQALDAPVEVRIE